MRWLKVAVGTFFLVAAFAAFFGVPFAALAMLVQAVPALLNRPLVAVPAFIVVTLVLGRIYCAAVCPLSVLSDNAAAGSVPVLPDEAVAGSVFVLPGSALSSSFTVFPAAAAASRAPCSAGSCVPFSSAGAESAPAHPLTASTAARSRAMIFVLFLFI